MHQLRRVRTVQTLSHENYNTIFQLFGGTVSAATVQSCPYTTMSRIHHVRADY